MEKLGIDLASLIAQVASFGILMLLLYLVAYKPILKMMDGRASRIKESLEQAEEMKKQAEAAEVEFKKQIAEASVQGQVVIERASKTADEIRQRAQDEAKVEAEALVTRAKADIHRERDEVIGELRKEFANLTILAAGKVLDENLDDPRNQKLVDQFIENIPDGKAS